MLEYEEERPFSYKDFEEYSHGSVRNAFLRLKEKGLIKPDYNSFISFYRLVLIRKDKDVSEGSRHKTKSPKLEISPVALTSRTRGQAWSKPSGVEYESTLR